MGELPHDVMRLKSCPQCDYDLTALPRDHQCPECGTKYNSQMGRLDVWRTKAAPSFAAVFGYGIMTAIGLFPLLGIFRNPPQPPGSLICPAIWTICFGWAFVMALRRFRIKTTGRTDSRLMISASEIKLMSGRQTVQSFRWHLPKRVMLNKRSGYWRLRIYPPFFFFRGGGIDVLFQAAESEAAIIRDEIRRRVDNARRTRWSGFTR